MQTKPDGCFLCDAFQSDRDCETLVLKRGETVAVIMNRYPYNNGHLMIAPYRHIDKLEDLTDEESREMMSMTTEVVKVLKKTMNPDGLNIGLNLGEVAGAGLREHIHSHIVPRWNGDTNFMPVLGKTKVIPQSLSELWDQLHQGFNE